MRRLIKPGSKLLLIVLAVSVINTAAFLAWIITAPRSIPYLPAQIEKTLSDLSPNFDVTVGDTVLKWEAGRKSLGIHVVNVAVKDQRGSQLAYFPDIRVRLNMLSLLFFRVIEFKDLFITNPEFHVSVNRNALLGGDVTGALSFRESEIVFYKNAILDLLKTIKENDKKIPLKNIHIYQALIMLDNGQYESSWSVPEASVEFLLNNDVVTFQSKAEITFLDRTISLEGQGYLEDSDTVKLDVSLSNLSPDMLIDVFPNLGWLKGIDTRFGGDIKMQLSTAGEVKKLEGHMFSIETVKPEIEAWATLVNHAAANGGKAVPEVWINATVIDMPTGELKKYWPASFAPDARAWVTDNIRAGTYVKSTAQVHITPNDFLTHTLPDDAVKATVWLEDAEIDYFPGMPRLKGLTAVGEFNSNTITVDVQRAEAGGSSLSEGQVVISDMATDARSIQLSGRMEGQLEDLKQFFYISPKARDMETIEQMSGEAETHFTLSFPLNHHLTPSDIMFKVQSVFSNVSFPGVRGLDLTDGSFSFSADNNSIEADGEAFLNSVLSKIVFQEDLTGTANYQRKTIFHTYATRDELIKLGFPDMPFLSGSVDMTYSELEKGDTHKEVFDIDAKDAAIDLWQVGWSKEKGKAAKLNFVLNRKNTAQVDVPEFEMRGENIYASGFAKFATSDVGKSTIIFDNLHYGNNDIAVRYIGSPISHTIDIKGASLDLTPIIAWYKKSAGGENEEAFGLSLSADIDQVFLARGETMQAVSASLYCTMEYCKTGKFFGKMGEGKAVKSQIRTFKDTRVFTLVSDNAGALIRGFDILYHINGGDIEISAEGSPQQGGMNGKMIMKDFMVVKAPMLTKVLTLASLGGIVDLLNGEGITFNKAKGEFVLQDGKFFIKEGKAHGNSLGITLEGEMNGKSGDMDFKGTVIPSYALNTALDNVPVIGQILTGGEGKGVIAANYSIKGKYDDPQVSVNPLSILTPGFLRGIWGN